MEVITLEKIELLKKREINTVYINKIDDKTVFFISIPLKGFKRCWLIYKSDKDIDGEIFATINILDPNTNFGVIKHFTPDIKIKEEFELYKKIVSENEYFYALEHPFLKDLSLSIWNFLERFEKFLKDHYFPEVPYYVTFINSRVFVNEFFIEIIYPHSHRPIFVILNNNFIFDSIHYETFNLKLSCFPSDELFSIIKNFIICPKMSFFSNVIIFHNSKYDKNSEIIITLNDTHKIVSEKREIFLLPPANKEIKTIPDIFKQLLDEKEMIAFNNIAFGKNITIILPKGA